MRARMLQRKKTSTTHSNIIARPVLQKYFCLFLISSFFYFYHDFFIFCLFCSGRKKAKRRATSSPTCVAKIFCLLKIKRKKFQPISLFWLLEREVRIAVARRISLRRSNWNFKQGAPTCRSECWKPPRGRRVECTWRSGRARSRKPWNIQGVPKKSLFFEGLWPSSKSSTFKQQ